jgi:hypothetical protein
MTRLSVTREMLSVFDGYGWLLGADVSVISHCALPTETPQTVVQYWKNWSKLRVS